MHALEHRSADLDLRSFKRLARVRGRRLAWSDLCPICRARVRLGVARNFRRRANVLSGLLIGNVLVSSLISGEGMKATISLAGFAVCLVLATVPVWLRRWQLQRARERTCASPQRVAANAPAS